MSNQKKFSLLLVAAGIVAIAGSVFIKTSLDSQVRRDTEPAEATVVEYVEGTEHNSTTDTEDIVFYPVVTYEVNGQTVEAQYLQYDYEQVYEIGSVVDIKYNPDEPEEFYIVGDDAMDTGFMWGIPAGVLMILAGIAGVVTSAKRKSSKH